MFSCTGGELEGDGRLDSEATTVELGLTDTVLLLSWRLARRRSEVARGAFSEWTASRAVRSREKTPSWNLEDQTCRAEWMEDSSTSASRRWKDSESWCRGDGGRVDRCCRSCWSGRPCGVGEERAERRRVLSTKDCDKKIMVY